MRIALLADYIHFIPMLARWHFVQWGELTGSASEHDYERLLAARAGRGTIPTVLLAVQGDELIGSASLLTNDMDTRPDLSPWLAQVYVAPETRLRGVGSALVRAIVREALALGVSRLYLYTTEDRQAFYAKLGWILAQRVHHKGKERVIMNIESGLGAETPLSIRRAQPGDAAELTRIAHVAKRHWGYAEELMELWRNDLTVTAAVIEHDLVWCGMRGERIVGFCVISGTDATRELEHMWVVPDEMRKGVGARLLQHAIDTMRVQGVGELHIASDPNAEDFYLKFGARRVGQVPSTPAGRTLPLLVLSFSPAKLPIPRPHP